MDEPVPLRRAAVGCLILALAVAALGLIVRPAIFSLAPPRDDASVIVATAREVEGGPIRRDVILGRSHGWSGEADAGAGRVQLSIILSPSSFGGIAAVNAASPGGAACAVEIEDDRLRGCAGQSWTFEGEAIEPAGPPLERIGVEVVSGSVVLDLTQPVGE